MGKAEYSKFADFIYKDKELSLKIPIRVKIIDTKQYACKKCHYEGISKTNMKRIYMHRETKGKTIIYGEENKQIEKRFETLSKCVDCKKQLTITNKEIIYLYALKTNPLIDFERLLNVELGGRWIDGNKNLYDSKRIGCYTENLEEAKKIVEFPTLRQKVKKQKKTTTIILRPKKEITIEMLRKEKDLYEQRKIEKLI